jgi:peptidoglycan/LPS O-acetylase OafA/YrhL
MYSDHNMAKNSADTQAISMAPRFDASKSIYLEFYRGVAALGVALAHYAAASGIEVGEFLAVIFVEMFFPLSGFILAPQVIKVLDNHRALGIFYARRWIRTIPLYMGGLLAMALITYNMGSEQFFRYLTFVNFLSPEYTTNNFYPISWSLAAEEYYYLLFPLFMIFAPGKNLLRKVAAFICLGLIVKIASSFLLEQAFVRIGTLTRFDSIGIGFLCYLLKERVKAEHLLPAVLIGAIAIAAHYLWHTGATVVAFMYALNFAFGTLCCVIYEAEKRRPSANSWFKATSGLIGATSYAVYVVHLPVLAIAMKAKIDPVAYIIIVLMLSSAIHFYFERPLLKLRPQFKNEK